MSDTAEHETLKTWGQLLRLPNLFTVPGEAIAGFVLAAGTVTPEIVWPCIAVVLMYMGGLLLNDYFDREEDARERPSRPIPSGAAHAQTVLLVGCLLLLVGPALVFAFTNWRAGIAALVVSGLAAGYDSALKRSRIFGPIAMGLCRGGTMVVGALAANGSELPGHIAWVAAGIATCYTLALAIIAADETTGESPGFLAVLPMFVALTAMVIASWAPNQPRIGVFSLLFLLGAIEAGRLSYVARHQPQKMPKVIGALIRNMILLQAGWTVLGVSQMGLTAIAIAVFGFLCIRIAADLASRKFYGS